MTQDVAAIARGVMPAIRSLEEACSSAVLSLIPLGHHCGPITVNQEQWGTQEDAFERREAFFAAMMPTEQDAIAIMNAAYTRLKALGWNDPIYCPKDGSHFDVIEPGSTGIHKGHYEGEWPEGSWLVEADDDLYPSRPVLYRVTEAELERRSRFRQHLTEQEGHLDDSP